MCDHNGGSGRATLRTANRTKSDRAAVGSRVAASASQSASRSYRREIAFVGGSKTSCSSTTTRTTRGTCAGSAGSASRASSHVAGNAISASHARPFQT
jgi:hypothetical protein